MPVASPLCSTTLLRSPSLPPLDRDIVAAARTGRLGGRRGVDETRSAAYARFSPTAICLSLADRQWVARNKLLFILRRMALSALLPWAISPF